MDHRDCGAYKAALGENFSKNPVRETAVHAEQLRELRRRIRARHATLDVELLLIDLHGAVERIA